MKNFLLITCLFILQVSYAQTINISKEKRIQLDSLVQSEMRAREVPGLAYGICIGDELVHVESFGYADLQNESPVRRKTTFLLASITKQFTAGAIVLLQQDGKLAFSDPINKYLPEPVEAWKDVRIHHLLTHTSGLSGMQLSNAYSDISEIDGYEWLSMAMYGDYSKTNRFDAMKHDKLLNLPGDVYDYSNYGYFLLGLIVDHISGDYDTFIQERIFDRLGMHSSYILDLHQVHKFESRVYTRKNGHIVNNRMFWNHEIPSSYGIYSNIEDLQKWDKALNGDFFTEESKKIIWSANSLNSGQATDYGYGWKIKEGNGNKTIYHGGVTGTNIIKELDGYTIIVLTNLGYNPVAIPENRNNPQTQVTSWAISWKIQDFLHTD